MPDLTWVKWPLWVFILSTAPVFSQTVGCGDPPESDFALEKLADGYSELVQMDIAPDGRVFFAEKVSGKVFIYKPGTLTTVQAAQLSVYATNSTADSPGNRADGLLGLALDPAFASNNWLYLFYSVPGATLVNRVSRFTVVGDQLNMASETVILDVATHRNACCHSAGGILFDASGNLYVSTGDNSPVSTVTLNTSATGTSGNTNDLRGKILRVRPSAGGGYTIPNGNLFPPGTDSTRSEIYAMGLRNAVRFGIDPQRGWVLAGDVGPDNTDNEMDEFNMIKSAGNFGWPYFVGNYSYTVNGAALNPNNPVNTAANNTGKRQLPPARAATFWYKYSGANNAGLAGALFNPLGGTGGGRVAMAGPIYYYNPALQSTVKFPPHFHGKWFVWDYRKKWINVITLDTAGNFTGAKIYFSTLLFGSSGFTRVTDVKFGPDGSLYAMEYGNNTDYTPSANGAIFKINYRPPRPECLPSDPASGIAYRAKQSAGRFTFHGRGSQFVLPLGARGVRLFDVSGKQVWEYAVPAGHSGPATLNVPGALPLGVYHWKIVP